MAGWLLGAGGTVEDPNGIAPERYVYYPGTEPLAKDEIRVIACGTGLPAARRGQAATCFLIEAGNGEKYLFDIGTGSMANIARAGAGARGPCAGRCWRHLEWGPPHRRDAA